MCYKPACGKVLTSARIASLIVALNRSSVCVELLYSNPRLCSIGYGKVDTAGTSLDWPKD